MQPNLKIETWPIENVINYARNARLHSDGQVAKIAASMKEFGFINPCIVDPDGILIAGHGRVMAAKLLGINTVPVIQLGHLTENQIKALRIADNQIALEGASWSPELLRIELNDLQLAGYDMPLLGFDNVQLVNFMANVPSGADPEATPEPPVNPVSRTGDIWLLGKHRLLCGDSTKAADVAALMGTEKAVLMNTDPPYGVDYAAVKNGIPRSGFRDIQARGGDIVNDDLTDGVALQAFLEKAIRSAIPHMDERAAFYFWHPMLTQGTFFAAAAAADILIHRQIIWVKPHMVLTRSGQYHWRHELCFYGWVRGKQCPWYGNKSQTSVWDDLQVDDIERSHPTQKPTELFERPILNHTRVGEIAYEPFSGSGSQIIAAERQNRRCFALEITAPYVDVAVLRWQTFTKAEATLERDGRTFAQIAKERLKLPKKRAVGRSNRKMAPKPKAKPNRTTEPTKTI
jgi:DNA modification methylase